MEDTHDGAMMAALILGELRKPQSAFGQTQTSPLLK